MQRRSLIGVGAAAVVVVALIVAVLVNRNGSGDASSASTTSISASNAAAVIAAVTGVPAATFDTVGRGDAKSLPTSVNGTAIAVDGKPEVLYVGAEYCPFCAAERWPLAIALSRFGTFSGIGLTHSSSTDVYPDTATLSFHGATYTSDLIAFTAIEVATNVPNGSGGYTALDTPTAAQSAIVAELSPGGGIPFVDFGGKFLISGATYDPGALQGKTATEIAGALSDPTSSIGKAVLGTANTITATICQMTGGQPGAVCSSPAITNLTASLGE